MVELKNEYLGEKRLSVYSINNKKKHVTTFN